MRRTIAAAALIIALLAEADAAPAGNRAVRGSAQLPTIPLTCPNARLPGWLNPRGTGRLQVVQMRTLKTSLRLAVVAKIPDMRMGLMCVQKLPPRNGMIFAFPASREWTFWMRNMLVPVDIAWIEADGRVNALAENMPANQRSNAKNGAKRHAQGLYVVEVPAGEARRDGLAPNDLVMIPRMNVSVIH